MSPAGEASLSARLAAIDAERADSGRDAAEGGTTVATEQAKRGGRRTRKIGRMLKRAARKTERMAAELEQKAEACFAGIGKGSGAFVTQHYYDPSIFRKRGQAVQGALATRDAVAKQPMKGCQIAKLPFQNAPWSCPLATPFGDSNAPTRTKLREATERELLLTVRSDPRFEKDMRPVTSGSTLSGAQSARALFAPGTSELAERPDSRAIQTARSGAGSETAGSLPRRHRRANLTMHSCMHPREGRRENGEGNDQSLEIESTPKSAAFSLSRGMCPSEPRADKANSINIAGTAASDAAQGNHATAAVPQRQDSESKTGSVFVNIPSTCNNRPDIPSFQTYMPPYPVEKLLADQHQAVEDALAASRLLPTSSRASAASTAVQKKTLDLDSTWTAWKADDGRKWRPGGDGAGRDFAKFFAAAAAEKAAQKPLNKARNALKVLEQTGRQEIMLNTRLRTPRKVHENPDEAGIAKWMVRQEQKQQAQAADMAAAAKAAEQRLHDSKAARHGTAASTASSTVVFERIRHSELTYHNLGMRARGVICQTYQTPKPIAWDKLEHMPVKESGITGGTVQVPGGVAALGWKPSVKGPCLPMRHTRGEFENLVVAARIRNQDCRPWFGLPMGGIV